MTKKRISLLLVLCMLLSMLPVSAAAASGTDTGYITGVNVTLGTQEAKTAKLETSGDSYTITVDALTTTTDTSNLKFAVTAANNTNVVVYKLENDTETTANKKTVSNGECTFESLAAGDYSFRFYAFQGEYDTSTAHKYTMSVKISKEAAKTYTVTVSKPTNGTVTASKTTGLNERDEVTLTVKPDSGYELDKLTVTDAANKAVTVTNNKFTMPASNVTVTATFKKTAETPPPVEPAAPTVTLSKSEMELLVGDTGSLTAAVTPANAQISWESSKTSAATVTASADGKTATIYALAADTTIIKAIVTANGKTASAQCTVTVKAASVEGVGTIINAAVEDVVADTEGKAPEVSSSMTAAAEQINNNKEMVAADGLRTAASQIVKPEDAISDARIAELAAGLDGEAEPYTVIVPKIEIKVSNATTGTAPSLTFEITAFADIRVTKQADAANVTDENSARAKTIPLNDTKQTITITLPLPDSFQNMARPVVKHRKTADGPILWHRAENVAGGIKFSNSQGFSEFAVENASGVAVIGEQYYNTIAEAITAARSGATIVVLDNNLTAENVNKALTIQPAEGVTGLSVSAGTGYKVTPNADGSYTVTEKSSGGGGGGGGGGSGSSKPSVKPGDKPATPGTTAPGGVAGFNDVAPGAWYADSVKFVVDRGLFGGVGNGRFAPNDNMTRAMMWTVLARYKGVNTNTGSNWYEAARAWAIEQNISDGTMADGNVTREQFVTMLWRLSGEPTVDNAASFTDSGKVSDYAKAAVDWAVAQGIVNGYSDGTFKPQGSATRAEVAKMLTVFVQNEETA